MKNRIIRINDINEIDTTRVSVYDLNNRYVDARGNMYGLKYNRADRRVEIIKIMRTHTSDASQMHQEIIRKKLHDRTNPDHEKQQIEETKTEDIFNVFDPDIFIDEMLNLMKTHKDRLKGIIMNIKKSNLVSRENKNESVIMEDLFRNIEIDGLLQMDKLENYQKELSNYPRSITYYQAKLDDHGREMIDSLAGNTAKVMRFIYLYEMKNMATEVYRILLRLSSDLHEHISHKEEDDLKALTPGERQSYQDALVSLTNTIGEIRDFLSRLKLMDDYIENSDNL